MSLEWFKGKCTGKPSYLVGKTMVSCRLSLKRTHCVKHLTISENAFLYLRHVSLFLSR